MYVMLETATLFTSFATLLFLLIPKFKKVCEVKKKSNSRNLYNLQNHISMDGIYSLRNN